MKIDKITIHNFRCFDLLDLSFGKKATVIIGKNGTGKSSIISALRRGLSFIFAKNKYYKNNLYANSNSNIRGFEFWDARFNEIDRIFNYPVSVKIEGNYFNSLIDWTLFKDSNKGKFHSSLYKDAQTLILDHYNNNVENSYLPLLAFYSDSYPHVLTNVGNVAKSVISKDIIPRDFGYYGWDDMTNCMELWLIRYKKITKYIRDYKSEQERISIQIEQIKNNKTLLTDENLNNLSARLEILEKDNRIHSFTNEKEYIDNKIFKITEPLRNDLDFINEEFQIVRLMANKPTEDTKDSLEFIFKNGSSIFFEMLPQGYKRLISITLDLAFRNYALNKDTDSEGIVFIDELELHLHPTLQQEVLPRFQKAFPKLQFIVSTHSPLVISNLMTDGIENKIIKLNYEDGKYSKQYIENVYGLDYTTNLKDIMGSDYRPTTIDKYINAYLFLYGKNKTEDANKMIEKLKEYLGGTIPKLLLEEINNQKKFYM